MRDWARREWGLLLVAVQVLTRLPVRAPHGPDAMRRASPLMPLVGLGVGLVAAGAFALASLGLPPGVAAFVSLAATLALTGALHEDGLADCCDGLLGGRTGADALRIMRDSRIGAFGTLGLIVVVGAKLACLAALPDAAGAMIAAHASSRFWMLFPPAALPYARTEGMAAGMAAPDGLQLVAAAVPGLVPLALLGPAGAPALIVSAAVALLLLRWVRRRLGGYTGDVLGLVQQATELTVLLVALWHAD